jgi:hypothetical protein
MKRVDGAPHVTIAQSSWPNAIRIAHLAGGARARNPPGSKIVVIPESDIGPIGFELSEFGRLYDVLAQAGIQPLGVDFIDHVDEQEGLYPPKWRPYHPSQGAWLVEDSYHVWRQIANAGVSRDDYELFDLASRIAFAMRVASLRLRDLSTAYNRELMTIIKLGKFKAGKRTRSLNTFQIGLEISSFFAEVCSLRDYLAEFSSSYVFIRSGKTSRTETMAKLVREIVPELTAKDPLADELARIFCIDPPGWLTELTAYRNLAVHSIPAGQLVPGGLLKLRVVTLSNGARLPQVTAPLPPKPLALKKLRSNGPLYKSIEEWHRAIVQAAESDAIDALNYCHNSLGRIAQLAMDIARRSPVPPKPLTITENDIKGTIEVGQRPS